MPWFPDIAGPAFCETLHLRNLILEQQRPSWTSRPRVLEPGSAEFISALAAGSNSRRILHVGCGLSSIALAAAARATGGCIDCVDTDSEKQATVFKYVVELGLHEYIDFYLEKPSIFIAEQDSFDFVLLTGEPELYIEYFDLLRFTRAAIIVAYNALDEATNEYIKHVRQQPGIDSSTLPVGRGIEVSKILSWDAFNSGRKSYRYCEPSDEEYTSSSYFPGSRGLTSEDFPYDSLTTNSCSERVQSFEEAGVVSPTVSVGTSLEEESERVHAVNYEQDGELHPDIFVLFNNLGSQTEIKVVGPDQQSLLVDISLALCDAKVSVQGAKISTTNERVEDVFYVVDEESKQQLGLEQQELVRRKILKRVLDRNSSAAASGTKDDDD